LSAYVQAFGPATTKPTPTPAGPTSDFEQQFRELQEQWNDLDKKIKEIPKSPAKP
jgi:hypothetical protein